MCQWKSSVTVRHQSGIQPRAAFFPRPIILAILARMLIPRHASPTQRLFVNRRRKRVATVGAFLTVGSSRVQSTHGQDSADRGYLLSYFGRVRPEHDARAEILLIQVGLCRVRFTRLGLRPEPKLLQVGLAELSIERRNVLLLKLVPTFHDLGDVALAFSDSFRLSGGGSSVCAVHVAIKRSHVAAQPCQG